MSGWRQVGDRSGDIDRPCSHFRRSADRRLACLSFFRAERRWRRVRLATWVVIFRPARPCDVRAWRRVFNAPTPLFRHLRSSAFQSSPSRRRHVIGPGFIILMSFLRRCPPPPIVRFCMIFMIV
uniref:Uncharacterized protein n=1 Tax=Plectus sambesii TaxID=2011161 RepID=A0A914X3Q3_9BILA